MRIIDHAEQFSSALPQPVSWVLVIGPTIAAFFEALNPILTALSLTVGICWGCLQIYLAIKRRK